MLGDTSVKSFLQFTRYKGANEMERQKELCGGARLVYGKYFTHSSTEWESTAQRNRQS